MKANSNGVPATCASKLSNYALLTTSTTCEAYSTDSSDSITLMPNGYTNSTMLAAGTNNTLGITYTNPTTNSNFTVGLVCNKNLADGVTN